MGEGVRRIPPAADSIGERGVHRRRRCVDRGGVSYEKAGGGAFNHFAAQWRGEDSEQDRKGHNIRSHSVPLSFESSSDAHRSACCHVRCQVPVFVSAQATALVSSSSFTSNFYLLTLMSTAVF